MLKDITLGQYFPGNSLAHRLDPRTKILLTVVYIVMLFCAKSFVSYGVVAALLKPPTHQLHGHLGHLGHVQPHVNQLLGPAEHLVRRAGAGGIDSGRAVGGTGPGGPQEPAGEYPRLSQGKRHHRGHGQPQHGRGGGERGPHRGAGRRRRGHVRHASRGVQPGPGAD